MNRLLGHVPKASHVPVFDQHIGGAGQTDNLETLKIICDIFVYHGEWVQCYFCVLREAQVLERGMPKQECKRGHGTWEAQLHRSFVSQMQPLYRPLIVLAR